MHTSPELAGAELPGRQRFGPEIRRSNRVRPPERLKATTSRQPVPRFCAVLLPATLLLTLLASGSAVAQPPPAIARVVRQYALTSANDFPQRDPQDWRLLGSNDGGKSWTTVDSRRGELFSQRHQRRVFKVQHPAAFDSYRLQIDRVREPAAADSVQLAEIEPTGETEQDLEPAPLPEDVIFAQGDNPPLEGAVAAFDGAAETKWLDHAAAHPTTRASWIQWRYAATPATVLITNVQRLAALKNRASEGYPVRIEGFAAATGSNVLTLLDSSGCVDLAGAALTPGLHQGQPLRVEGRSRWVGNRVDIEPSAVQRLGPEAPANIERLDLGRPPEPGPDLRWVEVQGNLSFCTMAGGHLGFDLETGENGLAVRVLRPDRAFNPRQWLDQRIQVTGLCELVRNAKGESVPNRLWALDLAAILPLGLAKPRAEISSATSGMPRGASAGLTLTNLDQIRRLGPEILARQPRVKATGVVTELFGGYMQEDGAGVEIWLGTNAPARTPVFGTRIEVEGRGDWALGHGPIIRVETIRNLGRGQLPRAERCSWSQLASGRQVNQWVEVEGVAQATDGSHLLLSCEGGQLMATVRSGPAPQVKGLVDATVRVRGVCVPATDSHGRMQGIQILVPSLEFVEVEQPPADPASLRIRKIGTLLQVRGPESSCTGSK